MVTEEAAYVIWWIAFSDVNVMPSCIVIKINGLALHSYNTVGLNMEIKKKKMQQKQWHNRFPSPATYITQDAT